MSDGVEQFVERRMRECRSSIDTEVKEIREDVKTLHARLDAQAADVHRITISVGDINNSLKVIADSMSKLSDLPIVWDRVKSFWMVMSWIQKNFLPLSILIALLVFAITDAGIVDLIKGLMS